MEGFLFLSQVPGPELRALSREVNGRMGPVRFHSGTPGEHRQDGVAVHGAPSYVRTSLPRRLTSWLLYVLAATRVMLFSSRPSLMVVNTNPPLLPIAAALVGGLRGVPWIAVVLDVYPDALAAAGMSSRAGVIFRIWSWFTGWSLRRAEAVITLGSVMAERLVSHGVPASSITVLPTGADPDAISPRDLPDEAFFPGASERSSLRVLYSGNLGHTHNLSGLFRVLEGGEFEDLDVLLVGGGTREDELREIGQRGGLSRWLPSQPSERLRDLLGSAQLGLVTLGRGAEGVSMPSKAYYLMAAGCALLGLSHGDNDLSRLIEDTGCGLNVDTDDDEAIEAALRRFQEDPAFLASCQGASRRAAVERYASSHILERQLELLERARTP